MLSNLLFLSVLFSTLPTLANICDITYILQVNAIKQLNKTCSEITADQVKKIKALDLSTSTAAEKCNRPEVIYKSDLKLFKSIEVLKISRSLLNSSDAIAYLKNQDTGLNDKNTIKTDGRFGPCVTYSDQDRHNWDQMWSIIDKKTLAQVPDIAENFQSIASYFPDVKVLKIYPFQMNESLEPIIKSFKSLEHLDACPSSQDSRTTVLNQIQNLKSLKLEACFLVSSAPYPPTLGASQSLTKLTIKENKWTFQDPNYFLNTPNLENLDLSQNNLKTLPVGLFLNLKKLKKVNMKRNSFSKSEKQRILDELLVASPQLIKKNSILF